MKPRNSNQFHFLSTRISAAVAALMLCHFATPSVMALTYYWDNNGTTGGFGTAAGTWAEPTTGSATQGWSQDASGVTLPVDVTTTTSDDINFGTGSLGLVGGTITIPSLPTLVTVDAANLTFDDNSGNIILSGGAINLGATATINNGGNTNTISSALSGAATSLAFTGGGTLIFSNAASAAGSGSGANATVSGNTILRFSGGGHGALGGGTGFNINLGAAGSGGTLALGNSGTVANPITVIAGSGTRTISNSGSPSGTFSGAITANENLAVNNSGVNTISTSGAGSSIAAAKTITYTASSSGTLSNSAIFSGNGAITYTGSSTGNISVSGAKTYSGGSTLNAMTDTGAVVVTTNSTGPANAPTDGAFGTGTLTIGATKVRAGTTADITVGNPITFSGNPTFTTLASEKSLIFSGNASLGATRTLTVSTGSTVPGEFVEFSGNITGAFGITKAGTGVLRFRGAKSYSGATTLNAGKLVGVVGGNSASSTVNLNNVAATLGVEVADNTLSWTCSAFTATAAGVLEFNFGAVAPSTTVSPLTVTNAATFTDTPSVNIVVDAGLAVGVYPLMTWTTTSGTAPTAVSVSNVTPGTFASLSVTGTTLNLVIDSGSAIIIKEDNIDNLSLGTSWVGGAAPDATKIAKWNNTVTTPNTTVLGANIAWAGIAIENPGGLVTIDAGHTLTLGAALDDINMSTADTADLTLNCPLAMNGDNRWNVAATRTVTLGGQVSGAFDINKQGAGTAVLSSAANSYTGTTTISAGTLRLGASNVIPNGASIGNVSVAGMLDLNGNNDTVNGISGAGTIDNALTATTSTLTVGANNQTSTYSGLIQDSLGTLNLAKIGSGTLTLASANTLSGSVAVSGGTLVFTNTDPLNNASGISLGTNTTLTSQTTNIDIAPPITLSGTSATISFGRNTADDGAFTLAGGISGTGNLTITTPDVNSGGNLQTIVLSAACTHSGNTTLTTGNVGNAVTVRAGVDNTLPVTTILNMNGGDGSGSGRVLTYELNGNDQTLAGLNTNISTLTARNQRVNNSGAAAILTINNTIDCTYGGPGIASSFNGNPVNPTALITGAIALTKSGAGKFTLLGSNSYTGATTITGGTLALGANNTLPNASATSIGAATLDAATFDDTVGTLNVTGAATINLGAGANLVFADSSGIGGGVWAGTLNITGTFVSGSSLKFGASTAALTVAQLALITVNGSGTYSLDSNGFLITGGTSGYSAWATLNGAGPNLNDDHDNDGVDNGTEYFIGGSTGNTTGFTPLPGVTNTAGTLSVTWTKSVGYTGTYGTHYVVETSPTLSGVWTTQDADPTPGFTVTFPSATEVKFTFPAGTTNFARLKVTGP